jgi:hypothetical protein
LIGGGTTITGDESFSGSEVRGSSLVDLGNRDPTERTGTPANIMRVEGEKAALTVVATIQDRAVIRTIMAY